MRRIAELIFNNIYRTVIYTILVISVLLIVYVILNRGYEIGLAIAALPILLLFYFSIIEYPFLGFMLIFVANYYISGIARYLPSFSPGLFMDGLLIVFILALFLNGFNKNARLKIENVKNSLTLVAFIWLIFCSFLILNPNSTSILAWVQSARGMSIYFLVIVTMVALVMRRYKDVRQLLFIWAILSITAVLKAYIQKNFGFDGAELRWLSSGGSRTHFINTGIRYFSFYTDAANFGTGIAFAGVVFGISSLYFKKIGAKVFFLVTSMICAYGMMISGTRGSLAVPFVSLFAYTILSKNFKAMILSVLLIGAGYGILRYTDFGQWNTYVRRMRTAFDPEDQSFNIRKENQAKLRTYMWDKPFGAGIGMARKRSDNYTPDFYLSKIPTDSWYVLIWVETGIVGLILHLLILLYIISYGSYLVLFRLKNAEIKGFVTALICGISGVYVSSYSIEIMGQFPTGFILYTCMAIVFLSPIYDKELEKTHMLR